MMTEDDLEEDQNLIKKNKFKKATISLLGILGLGLLIYWRINAETVDVEKKLAPYDQEFISEIFSENKSEK